MVGKETAMLKDILSIFTATIDLIFLGRPRRRLPGEVRCKKSRKCE